MKLFITAADVAPLIGFDRAAQFLRARPRLECEQDFPLPMPTCQRPLKWRADQVQAWADVQGTARPALTAARAARSAGHNVVLLEEARRS